MIVFAPTFREIAPEAEPEATAVPFTLTLAVESVTVGVTLTDAVEFPTETVYEVVPEENVGDKVPVEVVKAESVATAELARVTVIV